MLVILGTIRLVPDRVAAAKPAMAAMIAASRSEPGCVAYVYSEDVLEPGLIHVTEMWNNRQALDEHFATAHVAAWRAVWQPLGISDRRLSLYETGDPQPI